MDFAFRTFGDFFLRDIHDLGIFAPGAFDFYRFQFVSHPVLLKGFRGMDSVFERDFDIESYRSDKNKNV